MDNATTTAKDEIIHETTHGTYRHRREGNVDVVEYLSKDGLKRRIWKVTNGTRIKLVYQKGFGSQRMPRRVFHNIPKVYA